MERREFLKKAGALSVISTAGIASANAAATPADAAKTAGDATTTVANTADTTANTSIDAARKEIYEWRIYTLTGDGQSLDDFLENTLLPAYQRKKIKTAAFKPYKPKDGEKEQRHIALIYPNMETYLQVKKTIWDDALFRQKAQPFFDATASGPVYSNIESYLCEAFDKIPVHRKPDPSRTLFEIRIYHSPNEEANQRKVKMFNQEEIDLFDKVAIHSVLYGEILSGPRMPALLYLTWYKDEQTRSEAWKQFVNHPDWKEMSARPEYAHTATNNQSIFLSPLPFSQL
jgi:hypothetical protein